MTGIALDILLMVAAGLVGGLVAQLFRQPLLLGYLIAGIAVGPHTPGWTIGNIDQVKVLADVGAALLLFSLGLEFPLKSLKPIRKIAFGGTLIQVTLTLLFCAAFGIVLGFGNSESWWFGAAFVSSSTAVILKTLSSQGYAGVLSGRLMLGMSIVQDLTVVPIMILLCHLAPGAGGAAEGWFEVIRPVIYTGIFVAVMMVIGSRLTPRVLYYVAQLHSRELFLLVVTVLGLGVGYLTSCFGLSYAFGAFIAGMVLSESDYSHRAVSELGSLRDIFVLIFFVSVGTLCNPMLIFHDWQLLIGVFLIATFGRGALLAGISYIFGYRRVIPVAVLFGMLPVSEIAFVLIQQGMSIGAISERLYNLILNVTVLSMLAGPLFAGATAPVYRWFRRLFPEKQGEQLPWERSLPATELSDHLILTGEELRPLTNLLNQIGHRQVIIEPDHKHFLELKEQGYSAIFGDPLQSQIMEAAGAARARLLILSAGSTTEALVLIGAARSVNPRLAVLVHWYNAEEKPEGLQQLSQVAVIDSEIAAACETMRAVLYSLGWSMPEVHGYLRRVQPELLQQDAHRMDRYGFPLFMQFFGTVAWKIAPDARWNQCAIRDSRIREEFDLSIIGVARGEEFLAFPPADFVLQTDDRLLLLGRTKACENWNQHWNTGVVNV